MYCSRCSMRAIHGGLCSALGPRCSRVFTVLLPFSRHCAAAFRSVGDEYREYCRGSFEVSC